MLRARGAPQLEASEIAKHEEGLAHGAGRAMHEHALTAPHPGRPMKQLIRGRPAQNQRGRLRDVDAGGNTGQIFCAECAISGVRSDHRQIGHAIADLKAVHVITELVDFPDDVIAHHERRPEEHRLRVDVTPNHHIGVLDA
jgi:hypothetical protein